MEYEYRLVDRDLAVDGVKRLLPDIVWKIANTELVEGIGLPEVKMICDGKTAEEMTVKEVITVHNLKRAMQFMLANLDRPVDLDLVKEYNRIIGGACLSSQVKSEATQCGLLGRIISRGC